ncbi:hypothetical protein [Lysobacter tyrosinilyticus]
MRPRPRDLLTALLDACRRGLVTHEEAAKLVGIRKSDLSDLVAWRMLEVAAWRTCEAAFYHAFPECNPRLWRLPSVELKQDNLLRGGRASQCRHYSTAEARYLQPSQAHIHAPELENGEAWENGNCDERSPALRHRAPPRDTGWRSDFDWAA